MTLYEEIARKAGFDNVGGEYGIRRYTDNGLSIYDSWEECCKAEGLEVAKARCRLYRRRVLEISQQVSAVHVAPAFSCIEIVDACYNELMRPWDIFIMSKGHGCLTQYVVLEDKGLISRSDIEGYCKPGGRLGAHPDYAPSLGIHASTGSLGHGLSIALGQAYGERLQCDPNRLTQVYCLISDGELQEGSTWEAIMMAANLEIRNLTLLIDNNDFGGMDQISKHHKALYPIQSKLQAFGWGCAVVDGHNSVDIVQAVTAGEWVAKPWAVVCKTIKGKGVSFMEGVPIWHYRSPNKEEYQQALQELEL